MERGRSSKVACLFLLVVFCRGRITAGQINNGAVILWRNGGSSVYYTSGIVEVHQTGLIGNVCQGNTWGQAEADTVCRQLGYTAASGYGVAGDGAQFGMDEGTTLLNKVSCQPDSVSIWQCAFSSGAIADLSCTDQNDVFVQCYTQRIWDTAPYEGMVRLQDGFYVTSGRVEVYCNGQWGTICASAFEQAVADTVCVQLGYEGALEYNHLDLPTSSDTPQWLSDFSCSQPQSCVAYCSVCPAQAIIPASDNQATVKCYFDDFHSLTVESCQFEEDCEDCSSNMPTILGSVAASIAVLTLFIVVPLVIWCCIACHPQAHEQETKTKTASLTDSSETDVEVARLPPHKTIKVNMATHVGVSLAPPPYESSFREFYKQQPQSQVHTSSPPPPYYQ